MSRRGTLPRIFWSEEFTAAIGQNLWNKEVAPKIQKMWNLGDMLTAFRKTRNGVMKPGRATLDWTADGGCPHAGSDVSK